MRPDEFIEWLAPAAKAQADCYDLPASVLIAQGAIESGWGRSVIGKYNLFGRKWGGWGNYIEVDTQEYYDGAYHDAVDKFQDYESLLQACDDWCILITQEECYGYAWAVWCGTHDIEQFVRAMAPVYATDPNYAESILVTIRANDLTRFDR